MDTAERMLILCSSPYTVFNSINLFLSKKKCNQDLIADIIIFKKTNLQYLPLRPGWRRGGGVGAWAVWRGEGRKEGRKEGNW